MGYLDNRWVKLRGLNKRQIAVDRTQISFLEENELDGKVCTNVHTLNGKWVTSAHSLDEVHALITDEEHKESEERVNRWREQARAHKQFEIETDTVLREMNITSKPKSTEKQTNPDGSYKYIFSFEAPKSEETK